MKIREALLTQAPSLALQRAAQDEIARLDRLVQQLGIELDTAQEHGYNEGCTDGWQSGYKAAKFEFTGE